MKNDKFTNADIEDFQYGMLQAFYELGKQHTELNFTPGMIEAVRALNKVRSERDKKNE